MNIMYYKYQLLSLLDDFNDQIILDYGCGEGDFINLLLKTKKPPKLIWTVDILPTMINVIDKRFANELSNNQVVT